MSKVNGQRLAFVTTNPRKFAEAQEILQDFKLQQVKIEIPEIQGDARTVVEHKVREAAKKVEPPFFVDDTSLEFEAWGGLPGVYINDFMHKVGRENLVKMLAEFENKKATAVALIGYADQKGEISIFEGRIEGEIVEPRGTVEFGWDPIFEPVGYKETFAEMGIAKKAEISHRKKALGELRKVLSA
ncbi:MAG: RdgB/HAM1 family non-canonical purine NTP pyrophosphatase [Candidatus Gracilibacteria bacterium]|nr:RdgB/HAM1 family non-canonical purine NTP pyrophosphatase [Candidatus Gracilibacteria bacterium]